jgi:peptidyl-prolyl cis-trans isomerase C
MKRRPYRGSPNEGAFALVFYLILSTIVATGLAGCFSRERVVLDKTVLSVNSRDVSTKEFAERLAIRLKDFDALHVKDETSLERAKEETVKTFVLETIARDYAAKEHLVVSSNEVDAQVADIRSHYPDDFSFRRALADEHLSLDAWKSDLESTLLQKKIFTKIGSTLKEPSEAEMKAYYDANKAQFQQPARVRLRQIVLEKEGDAKRILEELEGGADMAKLAKQFSVAPEGENGGDTGWLDKGTLEVFDQAFKMPIGTRSKVLKSPYGYHIYEVLKKQPEAHLSFQDAKAKIRAQLMERTEQTAFSAWLEEQVRKTSVKRNDVLIQAIKVTTKGS